MKKIIITAIADGATREFNSLNAACTALNATSPMNARNAVAFLQRSGYTVQTLEGVSIDGTSDNTPKKTLIEKIIDRASTIDKAAIASLEAEIVKMALAVNTVDDAKALRAKKASLEALKTPKADRASVIAWFTRELDAHYAKAAAQNSAPTAPTAPTEPSK